MTAYCMPYVVAFVTVQDLEHSMRLRHGNTGQWQVIVCDFCQGATTGTHGNTTQQQVIACDICHGARAGIHGNTRQWQVIACGLFNSATAEIDSLQIVKEQSQKGQVIS